MPSLYIIAGPNGAGKTTAAYTLMPDLLNTTEFVNADEIARGLSPFNVEAVAFEAGRLMLKRIDYLLERGVDFTIETTLSTRSYVLLIRRARSLGYTVNLFFVYLSSPEMAVERVAERVAAGGHHIPEDMIYRRYERALINLFTLYLPIFDFYLLIDNSGNGPVEFAKGGLETKYEVFDIDLWTKLTKQYGNDN